MRLIELIAWVAVELKTPHPDLQAIALAVDKALAEAVKLDLDHTVRKNSLVRMVNLNG